MDFLWGSNQKTVTREEAGNRLAYFFLLLKYNLVQIMVVNLMFAFCCLPVLTILPAAGALQYSFHCLLEGDTELVSNFARGLKLVFTKQWKGALVQLGVFAALVFAAAFYYYFGFIEQVTMFRLAACLMGLGLIYFLMISVYYYQILLQEKLSVRQAWKKGFFLASISFLPTFLFLTVIFGGFYVVACQPTLIFLLLTFFFGINGLISAFLYDYYDELWKNGERYEI